MRKIVVIDDDPDILELVSFNLVEAGFRVIGSSDGVRGFRQIREQLPDLIVLDLMLPGSSGIEVLRKLKQDSETRHIPIIILSARGEETDRIIGLELGADDYVTKPFNVRELILRIHRIFERMESWQDVELLECNGIVLDCSRYEVRVRGDLVRLTTTEFNLLQYLLINKGRVLTRDQLLDRVWGYGYGGTTRTLDTHIQRLRDKLGREGEQIETVRGVGYRIEPIASLQSERD